MDNYIQVHFENIPSSDQEIIIAHLADIGFDGFEQGPDFLNAGISEPNYNELALKDLLDVYQYPITIDVITQKNWNEEWEKSFEPVIVEDFCAIRASFHSPVTTVQHEIIITPKMSFGTGHHATTYQVIQFMQHINCKNKTVLDFGTGTAVLAILAEKLGAKEILAIDNDEWSINNAKENIETNKCSKIRLLEEDQIISDDQFDIILANINKHVILENLSSIGKHLCRGGVLILSGILRDDYQEIADAALKEQLIVKTHLQKYDWIALSLTNVNSY
jgi:ribosomal protein L11 methyltransferase